MPNSNAIKISAIVGLFVIVIAVAIAATAAKSDNQTTTPTPSMTTTDATTDDSTSNASYKDGTYSASGDYNTPENIETVNVTLTIASGNVTDATVTTSTNNHESRFYQQQFLNNYKSLVVGKPLSSLSLSRVSGSSLTSGGFNAAVARIKSQAQS